MPPLKCERDGCDADAVAVVTFNPLPHVKPQVVTATIACAEHLQHNARSCARVSLVMNELVEPETDDERETLAKMQNAVVETRDRLRRQQLERMKPRLLH